MSGAQGVPVEAGADTVGEQHASDCAVNNGPALEPEPCDCGADVNPAASFAEVIDSLNESGGVGDGPEPSAEAPEAAALVDEAKGENLELRAIEDRIAVLRGGVEIAELLIQQHPALSDAHKDWLANYGVGQVAEGIRQQRRAAEDVV